jgi:DNA-binding transcriptional regulator YdaS (Cro superfamily)
MQCAIDTVGGQAELAKKLGVTPQAVHQWVRGRRPIPVEQCQAIERATAGAVTAAALRPDLAAIFAPAKDDKAA